VRVAPHLTRIELHALEERRHPLTALVLAHADPEGLHPLGDRIAHAHARVQGGQRILEHDLDLTAVGAQLRRRQGEQVHAVEPDPPRLGIDQAQQRAADRGLAAPRLAHQGQGAPRRDLEVDAVDRTHVALRPLQHPGADGKPGTELLHPQQRPAAVRLHPASSCATTWQRAP
jgi:hypothetical protein